VKEGENMGCDPLGALSLFRRLPILAAASDMTDLETLEERQRLYGVLECDVSLFQGSFM
jgi:hypothetical protein